MAERMIRGPQEARRNDVRPNNDLARLLSTYSSAGFFGRMRISAEIRSLIPKDIEGYKDFVRGIVSTGRFEALPFVIARGPKGLCPNFKMFQVARLMSSPSLSPDERLAVGDSLGRLMGNASGEKRSEVLSFANRLSSEKGLKLNFELGRSGIITAVPLMSNPAATLHGRMAPEPCPAIFEPVRLAANPQSGDLSSFVQARETIFKVYDETRDNRHLRRSLRQWAGRSDDADPVAAAIRSENAFAQGLGVPPAPALGNGMANEHYASQRTEDAMPNYMSASGAGSGPSLSPRPAQRKESQTYQAPAQRQPETKARTRDAPAYRAAGASSASRRSQPGNAKGKPDIRTLGAGIPVDSRDIRLLLASSEKGEQLVQSLMEKLRSHGREKQREQEKSEESGESQDIEKAVSGIKQKLSEGKGGKKGGKSGKRAKQPKQTAGKPASEPRAGKSKASKGRKADKPAKRKSTEKPKPAKERKAKTASEKRNPAGAAKSGKAKRVSSGRVGPAPSAKEKPKNKAAVAAKASKKGAARSLLLRHMLPKARKK